MPSSLVKWYRAPLRRRKLRALMTAMLIAANCIGCAPVVRPPKRADFFRAEPPAYEQVDVPLPPSALPQPPAAPPPDALTTSDAAAGVIPRPLSLEEALQLGLDNSGVVRVLDGSSVSAAAATFYDPQIAQARARAALAAFDPSLTSSLYANWINQPPDAVFGPGLAEPTRRDEAGYTAAITKPWITGTETRIGYNPPLGYLYQPLGTSGFNPLYESNVEFTARQPLLRGGGFVNKAPIRIAQLRSDQTSLETRQAVMASVRSVVEAYWELYAAAAASRAIDDVVPLLDRVVQIEQERMAAQRSVRADVAKVQSQLRAVTQQSVAARSTVVQRELRLRNLLGLPPHDGYFIQPTSHPLQAPVVIDADASSATALELRPDIERQRAAVRTRENELLIAKNAWLPQLDAVGLYRWSGVGERLDDSISQMMDVRYTDWQTSLTFSMPIGRRAAAAGVRAAQLQLSREKALLQQASHAAVHQINALVREAEYTYQLYAEADARLKANTDWLEGAKIRYENPPPSGDDWLLAATNDYLTALRSQADAAQDAQTYLSRYNALLARLQEAMGTILSDSDVMWSCEGVAGAVTSPGLVPEPAASPAIAPTPMPIATPSTVPPSMPFIAPATDPTPRIAPPTPTVPGEPVPAVSDESSLMMPLDVLPPAAPPPAASSLPETMPRTPSSATADVPSDAVPPVAVPSATVPPPPPDEPPPTVPTTPSTSTDVPKASIRSSVRPLTLAARGRGAVKSSASSVVPATSVEPVSSHRERSITPTPAPPAAATPRLPTLPVAPSGQSDAPRFNSVRPVRSSTTALLKMP